MQVEFRYSWHWQGHDGWGLGHLPSTFTKKFSWIRKLTTGERFIQSTEQIPKLCVLPYHTTTRTTRGGGEPKDQTLLKTEPHIGKCTAQQTRDSFQGSIELTPLLLWEDLLRARSSVTWPLSQIHFALDPDPVKDWVPVLRCWVLEEWRIWVKKEGVSTTIRHLEGLI